MNGNVNPFAVTADALVGACFPSFLGWCRHHNAHFLRALRTKQRPRVSTDYLVLQTMLHNTGEAEGQHVPNIMSGHASARFGFGLDNSFATSFGHLGPTPQSGSVIRRLGDANGAFVSSAIRPRSNLSILIYCIPADIQPSHCGLLCIDEVRKERGHGNPRRSSNSEYIGTIGQCFRHACSAVRHPLSAAIEGAPE